MSNDAITVKYAETRPLVQRVLGLVARHLLGLLIATVSSAWERTAQRNAWVATCDDLRRRGVTS